MKARHPPESRRCHAWARPGVPQRMYRVGLICSEIAVKHAVFILDVHDICYRSNLHRISEVE